MSDSMTISEILNDMKFRFDDQYEVQLVPSVVVGDSRHLCRATIHNIPKQNSKSATHHSSYRIALNKAYEQVLRELRNE